jgi:hypothetical protein
MGPPVLRRPWFDGTARSQEIHEGALEPTSPILTEETGRPGGGRTEGSNREEPETATTLPPAGWECQAPRGGAGCDMTLVRGRVTRSCLPFGLQECLVQLWCQRSKSHPHEAKLGEIPRCWTEVPRLKRPHIGSSGCVALGLCARFQRFSGRHVARGSGPPIIHHDLPVERRRA